MLYKHECMQTYERQAAKASKKLGSFKDPSLILLNDILHTSAATQVGNAATAENLEVEASALLSKEIPIGGVRSTNKIPLKQK